jgi:hypothetical protein
MMLSNRSRILSSDPFGFLVGKNKTSFTLHSDALVGQSDPLLALINGGMLEAREGHAWLEDTDEKTFVRVGGLRRFSAALMYIPAHRCSQNPYLIMLFVLVDQ